MDAEPLEAAIEDARQLARRQPLQACFRLTLALAVAVLELRRDVREVSRKIDRPLGPVEYVPDVPEGVRA